MSVVCQKCGKTCQKRPGESVPRFARRRYCSNRCSNSVNGSKAPRPARLSPEAIMAAHIDWNPSTGCVEWVGAKNPDGYGTTSVKEYRSAHRLAYFLCHGPIPFGAHVLHRCDNPACVTPDHLFLGTHAKNMADKMTKNRQHRLKGEANGRAKLTASDVRAIRESPAGNGRVAKQYGVDKSTIFAIRNRRLWSHIA